VILWDVSFSFWYDDGGNVLRGNAEQAEYFHKHIIHPMDSHNSGCRVGTRKFGNLFEPAEIQHRADATLNLTVQRGEAFWRTLTPYMISGEPTRSPRNHRLSSALRPGRNQTIHFIVRRYGQDISGAELPWAGRFGVALQST